MQPILTAGATAETDATWDETGLEFWVEEPATITLVQSGCLIWYSQSGNVGPRIGLGQGTFRAYSDASLLYCGASFLTQRVDSGGAGGDAIGIQRGRNSFFWGVYITSAATTPSGFQGTLFLNYTSGKHASGDGVHNHSTCWNIQNSQTSGNISPISLGAPPVVLPEANYFLNNIGFLSMSVSGIANSPILSAILLIYNTMAEWLHFGTESEMGIYPSLFECTRKYARFPNYPYYSTQVDYIDGEYRLIWNPAGTRPLCLWMTHHAITKTISGSVSGSGGGTVNLHAFRDVDYRREELGSTSRSGNGAFSITIYDDTENVFVEAREDATHTGRSESGAGT
jgi:hypothetical protein